MSEHAAPTSAPIAPEQSAERPTLTSEDAPRWWRLGRWLLLVPVLLVPFYAPADWLIIGIFSMAAAVAAVGLTVLVGTAGQLSLAHAFFIAVGAYTYAFLAGERGGDGSYTGLGLPPLLGAVVAVLAAGVAGFVFSPVAARLRGLYLGVASIALVFIGEHVWKNAVPVTGGENGRSVEPLAAFGFELSGENPALVVGGVPFGARERLWYLAVVALLVAVIMAHRVVRGRPGRALQLMRDNSSAARSMGINVRGYKALVFSFSSLFAGAGGVLLALAFQIISPINFGLQLSILYLAMAVVGGLGSVGGTVLGAFFVTALPLVLDKYSSVLPFLAPTGSGGLDAKMLATFVFGAAIVLVIVLEPGGLGTLMRRLRARLPRRA
ncbi:branched-chain amino acid ABC transporter permease [Janibacter sp. YIM B02568]|uniref:branched-chain amino acid ABC transporter permease n=1 Tax=Janibacter endophyticus TaxID=2806261 RepID=UPI0019504C1B|nr:branched-chain amino acid ABC transporter permease [Janibacter endophyticus]MBM6545360.1 branched-chain amino acid ABC transporter permease [Janibacter endophyticus]